MVRYIESRRMLQVQSPVIPTVAQLIRDNPGTLSLGQGVVYYSPPPEVATQIHAFLSKPDLNRYQSVNGIPELRTCIWEKLESDNAISRKPGHRLMVTAGGNMAFSHAVLAIADPGDEIILPTPFYFNHEMAVEMAGCTVRHVPTDENYQLMIDALEAAVTPLTRAIVTVSPNNPTGVVYSSESLQAVNNLCREKGIYHIHDEAYEYFTYPSGLSVSAASFLNSDQHTISLYSLSKSYGFASWRMGYMLYPDHLYEALRKIQDTLLICPPVIAQYAAVAAMQKGKSYIEEKKPVIHRAREIFLKGLSEIEDICYVPPSEGAFYFLLKLQTDLQPMEVVRMLIENYQIATIPGDTFGITEGCYIRIAYGATEEKEATEGMDRLIRGLKAII